MLFYCNILTNSHHEGRLGGTVLNSKLINELTVSGTGSRFHYYPQCENRRGQRLQLTVDQTVAHIRTLINTANAVEYMVLNVFPEEDTTQATVPTTFLVDEVIKSWPLSRSGAPDYAYVLINQKGSGTKRYLVENNYLDLVSYAETASTSTYTTT